MVKSNSWSTIEEKDVKIAALEDKTKMLEDRVEILEKSNALLERKCDDLESYTRRQNIRIVGIPEVEGPEDGTACVAKVKEVISDLGLPLNLDTAIDRAHRIGPRKDREGRPIQRAMIVRFTSWRSRTAVYTNRKKEDGKPRFYTDLTKRRFTLKKKAEEKVEGNRNIKFVYADVNNNICLKLANEQKRIFNSMEELDAIIRSL